MRTLTTSTNTATQADVTTPAYLVEIAFSVVSRLSSRGEQAWNGQTWLGGRLGKVSGLKWDEKGQQSGALELINTDLLYSALVLGEGVAGRKVRIWKFYGDNPAVSDPVEVFNGEADEADIGADAVRITLSGENILAFYAPRRFIGASTGFNHLTPSGRKITWGAQTYILERGRG